MRSEKFDDDDDDDDDDNNNNNNNLVSTESSRWLARSCPTLLEVSLIVPLGFFCLLVRGFLFSLLIDKEAFSLHVANNFFCIPVFCPKLGLYLIIFNYCVCFTICLSISCCVTHIFRLCCCYSSYVP